ncbi:prepilin-type N-terminal cleavage/methylation domain-containing protein [Pseudoalteromonas sp. SSM20]|uniref:prepilin-type N-terminal cleavage/methylation domain-containing protein n=1 Tax=Pseudoalteromonas sp. SSM20 TaxID=3139394 RepID=UPI003BAC6942
MSRLVKNGFTLVELIIVIVLIGIVSLSTMQFIKFGAEIYATGTERDEVVAQARFALVRMSKELRQTTPNSIRITSGNTAGQPFQCLEYTPFKASSIYVNNPPLDTSASGDLVVVAFDNEDKAFENDRVTVYPQNPNDIYDLSNNRVRLLASDPIVEEANKTQRWLFDNGFALASPTQRLFVLNNSPVSFCVEGGSLYYYQGYDFEVNQPTPSLLHVLDGVKGQLLAQYITNPLVFAFNNASLTRNAIVNIKLEMGFNSTETLVFNHEVHIPNVP